MVTSQLLGISKFVWISAVTGAPVSEVTVPKKDNFRITKCIHVVRILGTENGTYPDIPLHPQLEEIGLLKLAHAACSGALFNSQKDQNGRGVQPQFVKFAKRVRAIGMD